MAKRDAQTTPTRKEVLIARREREQMRVIYLGVGLAAALIIIVLAIGAVQTFFIEPNAAIAQVDEQEVITRDYNTRVRYERFLLDEQYQQLIFQRFNASQQQTEDDQFSQFLINQYDQLLNQLLQQRSILDREVVDTMIDDILISEAAAERGVSASEDEINEFINRFLARREGGLTAQAATETETARADASATAALWTPTPTFTPSPTLTTTNSITPTATPADTPTPQPTATLNILDDSALSTQYTAWLGTLSDGPGVSEDQYRDIIRNFVLIEKMREVIGDDVALTAEQSNSRHILVETEEEAINALARLNAGEDFADLAAELSTDAGSASNGGDLGFVSRGTFVASVDEAAFTLPIGEISDPIESDFGWHILEVLEREERELSPADYARAQQTAYDDWLQSLRSTANIQDFWTPDKAPADPNNPLTNPPPLPNPSQGG